MISNSKFQITDPFSIAPNESLTGFIIRTKALSFLESPSSLLFKNSGIIKSLNFPDQIDRRISIPLPHDEILKKHTIYPLIKPTQLLGFKHKIIESFRSVDKSIDNYSNIGSSIKYSEIKFCPYCFKKQIFDHGFCWLLRDWQAPLLDQCPTHKCNLVSHSCNCHFDKITFSTITRNIFTGHCNKCFSDIWGEPEPKKTLRKTTKWISKSLDLEWPFLTDALHRTILHEKIIDKNSHVSRSSKLVNQLQKKYFRHGNSLDSKTILKELRKIPYDYRKPFEPEIFWKFVIDNFSTPKSFHRYLKKCGDIDYISYNEFDSNLPPSAIESCQYIDRFDIRESLPSTAVNGDYIRVIF